MPADGVKPSPSVLWHQADEEHPDDEEARRARYIELMVEHGMVIKRRKDQLVIPERNRWCSRG